MINMRIDVTKRGILIASLGALALLYHIPTMTWFPQKHSRVVSSEPTVGRNNSLSKININSGLYNNLSCPFEWSKYSCSRQGRVKKAMVARQYAQDHLETPNGEGISAQGDRRLLLVGDSTVRQIFIALGCWFWQQERIESYALDWQKKWPCHNTPNCIGSGPHSGFNVGSIRLLNGEEIHFIPQSGTLGNAEKDVVSRWTQELKMNNSITFGPNLAMKRRRRETLSQKDVLFYNLGFHDDGAEISMRLKDPSKFGHILKSVSSAPTFIYMTSLTQHFNTTSGQFYSKQKGLKSKCLRSVEVNPRRQEELKAFHEGINVDYVFDYNDRDIGEQHIGSGDCTHYCMPGPPDAAVSRLVTLLRMI